MHYNQKMWTFHLSFTAVTLIFHFTYTVDCTLPCVHGDCIHSYCQCDQYWQGNECDEGTLPSNNSIMGTLISIFKLIQLHDIVSLLAVCHPPCANGGTCIVPHLCVCPLGWAGFRCEFPR